jgi:hypothetical protein
MREWAARYGFTPQGFTTGDWSGAALAVGAGIGAMILLATVGLLIGLSDAPVTTGQFIAAVGLVVAMAAGGSISIDGVSLQAIGGGASASLVPLSITTVGFGVLAAVVARRLRLRGVRSMADAALQAARVWILLLAALLVVCLIGRLQITDASSTGGGFGALGLHVTAGIGSTLFFGSCWLAFVLAVAVIWRLPALLPPRAQAWRNRAGGAVAGVVAAVVLSAVIALLIIVVTAADSPAGSATLSNGQAAGVAAGALLLFAPNALLTAFGVAVGTPISVSPSIASGLLGSNAGGSTGASFSLLDVTDQEPIFWLVSIATAFGIVAGGIVAALHAPSPTEARRSFWAVGVAAFAVQLVIAVSTSVSVNGGIFGVQGSIAWHLHFVVAPLLGLLWGALGGWIGALLAPGMPAGIVNRVRNHADRARYRAYGGPLGPGRGGPF